MQNKNNKSSIPNQERLIFALDVATFNEAKKWIVKLDKHIHFFKIGLELLLSGDYKQVIQLLAENNKKIFADLKLFDIPITVSRSIQQLNQFDVNFVSVHGNDAILKSAVQSKSNTLKILAVTALTSLDKMDMQDLGFDCSISELVVSRAKRAIEIGCDGIISSGMELASLKQANINQYLNIVTPGVRPVINNETDDQKRTISIEKALEQGADYIVVGRPIRNAKNPAEAASHIQQTIDNVLNKPNP